MNTSFYSSVELEDSGTRPESRFFWAVLLSLLVHAMLSTFLWDKWDSRGVRSLDSTPSIGRELQLLLPPRLSATPTAQPAQAGSGPKVLEAPARSQPLTHNKPSSTSSSSVTRQTEPRSSRALNLSLPHFGEAPSTDARSVGSSTVFDSQLAKTLEDYQTRAKPYSKNRVPIDEPQGSFVGGRWQSLVMIGKLCFEVIAADPLDSLSADQWFPRDCE